MSRKIFCLFVCIFTLFNLYSCKDEDSIVCNISSISLSITDGKMCITPVFGEDDNCTYTIVCNLDNNEIGRIRQPPYILVYELEPDDIIIGQHVIRVDFYAKHEGASYDTDTYIERKFRVIYTIDSDGAIEIEKAEEIY